MPGFVPPCEKASRRPTGGEFIEEEEMDARIERMLKS
jgi:hypothetical protein